MLRKLRKLNIFKGILRHQFHPESSRPADVSIQKAILSKQRNGQEKAVRLLLSVLLRYDQGVIRLSSVSNRACG